MTFWNNFGPVVKEGLCEGTVYGEDIFNICKFYTSKSTDKPITLNDYLSRMKPTQNNIFYIVGDSVSSIENSPQLEGFRDKDVEVLFLTDIVDNVWVTVQPNYKGKDFKSITKGDIDLDNLNDEVSEEPEKENEIKFDDDKKEKIEEPNIKNVTNIEYDGLIFFMKETLKDRVNDVKISKKLTSSPVCLVADKTAMDIRLERYLLDQNQIPKGQLKNIEINIKHPIINKLKDNLANETEARDIVEILFGEACVLEGEPVANPGEFIKKLNKLLEV
jgi:molecular chaperone HtpG